MFRQKNGLSFFENQKRVLHPDHFFFEEEKATKKINQASLLKKYDKTKKLIRTIYIKNRLINYIYK